MVQSSAALVLPLTGNCVRCYTPRLAGQAIADILRDYEDGAASGRYRRPRAADTTTTARNIVVPETITNGPPKQAISAAMDRNPISFGSISANCDAPLEPFKTHSPAGQETNA